MSSFRLVRLVAVLVGAAVLFALSQTLGIALYIAIPAAIVAYAAVLVTLGLILKVEPPRNR
jgi:hypothetical protein